MLQIFEHSALINFVRQYQIYCFKHAITKISDYNNLIVIVSVISDLLFVLVLSPGINMKESFHMDLMYSSISMSAAHLAYLVRPI